MVLSLNDSQMLAWKCQSFKSTIIIIVLPCVYQSPRSYWPKKHIKIIQIMQIHFYCETSSQETLRFNLIRFSHVDVLLFQHHFSSMSSIKFMDPTLSTDHLYGHFYVTTLFGIIKKIHSKGNLPPIYDNQLSLYNYEIKFFLWYYSKQSYQIFIFDSKVSFTISCDFIRVLLKSSNFSGDFKWVLLLGNMV